MAAAVCGGGAVAAGGTPAGCDARDTEPLKNADEVLLLSAEAPLAAEAEGPDVEPECETD